VDTLASIVLCRVLTPNKEFRVLRTSLGAVSGGEGGGLGRLPPNEMIGPILNVQATALVGKLVYI
jgi:hypothetical protein